MLSILSKEVTVTNKQPSGEERQVEARSAIGIDGAPLSYILLLAPIVMVLFSIPLSPTMIVGVGKPFPISQSVYPLIGWLLGPLAGALTNGIGVLVGSFVFPHMSSVPFVGAIGAALVGLAAGSTCAREKRRWWWLPLAVVFGLLLLLYVLRASFRGVTWWVMVLGMFLDWSGLLLYILPTRRLFGRLIRDESITRVGLGLFGGTWMIAGLYHLVGAVANYYVKAWPNEAWLVFAPMAPVEHLLRCLIGTVVGTGVIAGLRATGLIKPKHACY